MSFYLILDRVQIKKKYEAGKAEVKFYSFVADDRISLPGMDDLLSTQDPSELRDKVKDMAKNILNRWEGIQVQKVKKGHIFEFGDTGKILFHSDTIPDNLDWIMLAIELDKDVRDLGKKIEDLLPENEIDSLSSSIMTLAGIAASPQSAAAILIVKSLVKGITFFMKKNKNDQIGLVEQSFIRELHYPNGRRSSDGVMDLTKNMSYDYTIFGTE